MTTAFMFARPSERAGRGAEPLGGLAAACAAVAASTCLAGGLLLAWRRASGAIESPPTPAALLAVAAAGIAAVAACDAARWLGADRAWALTARCGLAMGVAALALPGPWPIAGRWLPVTIAVVAAVTTIFRPRRPAAWRPAHAPRRVPPLRGPAPAPPPAAPATERPSTAVVRQRLERFEESPGIERVRARIVVAVPVGAKAAQGHVGFCPAFGETPAVEVTTEYDGVEATVTAAEVLPWGVRVECRLAEPAEEPFDIPVDVLARGPA